MRSSLGWLSFSRHQVSRLAGLFLTLLSAPFLVAGTLREAKPLSEAGTQYRTTEWAVTIDGEYPNPFDPREVALDLVVQAPSGRKFLVPGFYDHVPAQGSWKIRFTPQEDGLYQTSVRLSERGQVKAELPAQAWPVARGYGDGFLKPRDAWTWHYDSGKPFRALGENVGWEGGWRNKEYSYELLLGELSLNGANFFRTWMCYWNLPVEWKHVQADKNFPPSTTTYNATAAKRFDELVALCERLNLHFMLAIDWHGALMQNDKWPQYAYNVVNGGPAANPTEFFTHPEARALYKNRLRYLVARWGCSPSVGAWEFFNEIDNTVWPEKIPHEAVTAWHKEMSEYLKQIDPYGRIVTTSVSHRDIEGMNDLPGLDLNQRHIYIHTGDIPKIIRQYLAAHNKPYAIGEAGYDWDWNKIFDWKGEEFDDHFRRGLWYGIFSPTPLAPMSWWWEFFHDRKMIPYFRPVRAIQERMLTAGQGHHAELTVEAKDYEVYGVTCGRTHFIYVRNSGPEGNSVDVVLPTLTSGTYVVEDFDPETSTTNELARLTGAEGGARVSAYKLRRAEQRILILTPR